MIVYIVVSYHPSYGKSIEEVFTIRSKAEKYVQERTDKKFIDYKIIEKWAI